MGQELAAEPGIFLEHAMLPVPWEIGRPTVAKLSINIVRRTQKLSDGWQSKTEDDGLEDGGNSSTDRYFGQMAVFIRHFSIYFLGLAQISDHIV